MAVDVTFLPGTNTNNIDTNFERVRTALIEALGREGDLPNHMNADLDMNSNDVLNADTVFSKRIILDGENIIDVKSKGWSPVFAAVEYNNSIVMQLVDYVGGNGEKPKDYLSWYVGEKGYVQNISEASLFGGALIQDGNKGDITVSGAGAEWKLNEGLNTREFETRTAAEAWRGVDPMPESIVIRGGTSSGDGLGGMFVLGHTSPDTIEVAGNFYGKVSDALDAGNVVGFRMLADTMYGSKRWDFGSASGLNGMGHFQCHDFDENNRHIYTLQHSDGTEGPARIKRWAMDSGLGGTFPVIKLDEQNDTYAIGHQTLCVEYLGGDLGVKLWAAQGPKFSRSLVRFDYVPGGEPGNVEIYNIVNPEHFAVSHVTATISYDQKWIIARALGSGSGPYSGKDVISIFDIKRLVSAGPGDRWGDAVWRWTYEPYMFGGQKQPLQSVVSDGNYVYLMFGPAATEIPNIIRQYTFSGKLITETPEITVGKNHGLGDDSICEWEGARFVKLSTTEKPVLSVGLIQGFPYYKSIYVFGPPDVLGKGRIRLLKSGESGDQRLGTGSNHKITWSTIVAPVNADFDLENNRFVPPAGRVFHIDATVGFNGLTAGQLTQLYIYRNGSVWRRVTRHAAGARDSLSISFDLTPGNGEDYFEIFAFHAGSGADVLSSSGYTNLLIYEVF